MLWVSRRSFIMMKFPSFPEGFPSLSLSGSKKEPQVCLSSKSPIDIHWTLLHLLVPQGLARPTKMHNPKVLEDKVSCPPRSPSAAPGTQAGLPAAGAGLRNAGVAGAHFVLLGEQHLFLQSPDWGLSLESSCPVFREWILSFFLAFKVILMKG